MIAAAGNLGKRGADITAFAAVQTQAHIAAMSVFGANSASAREGAVSLPGYGSVIAYRICCSADLLAHLPKVLRGTQT